MKVRVFAGLAAVAACGGQAPQGEESSDLTFHQAPQITISSPAPGAFVPVSGDGMVDISGSARGSSLSLNGKSVAVDAHGNFHTRVAATAGINLIDAHLNGLWGGEAQRAFIYGNFAAPSASLHTGVIFRANAVAYDDHASDLDDFSSIARAMLAQVDMMQLVRQLPPYTYTFPLGSVDVSVTDVQFAKDQTVLDLSPRAVGAHMTGSLSQVAVSLRLVLHLDGTHTTNGTVSVDTVGFGGDLNAKYSAKDGAIVGSMARPDIALGTLKVTTDLNFDGVDDFLTFLANQFKDLIASTVANQIQGSAANHLALTLNQIGLPSAFDLRPYGLSATLLASDVFDSATKFDALGITVGSTTNFAWPKGTRDPGAPGSIVFGSAPATSFPDTTASVSVAFDALNQAAFAVWGQGALSRTVYPAKNWGPFKLDAVIAAPRLPPVLTPGRGALVHVSLGDIVIQSAVHTWIFDGPMQATVSATADVTLDIDPQSGALRMTLAGKPSIALDVNDLLGIVPDALLAPLSVALQSIAPGIVEKMIKPIEVPLPRLALAHLIQGSTASVGLAGPIAVSVDATAQRVMLSGGLAQY